jgi:asparagine synthase (glutamine-hydrolysing)
MAHGVEIRTPLVDVDLLKTLAPAIAGLRPGEGKLALARSPHIPLPDEIVSRAKTGFGVPTGQWMDAATSAAGARRDYGNKGANSRRWSQFVLQQQSPFDKALAAA